MPTVAVSSQVSDALYTASLIVLFVLLARPVYLVYGSSQQRGAEALAAGLGTLLDSMSPGTSVLVSLQSYPGVQLSVHLEGTKVAANFGGSASSVQIQWDLPQITMSAGVAYNFTLEGGTIVVSQARDG